MKKAILAVILASIGGIASVSAQTPTLPAPAAAPSNPSAHPTPKAAPNQPAAAPDADSDTDDGDNDAANDATPATVSKHLPALSMTSEIMFKLMASEIAFQRGNWQSSYATELDLAKSTKDPRIAQRATEMALSAQQAAPALAAAQVWASLDPDSDQAQQYLLGLVIAGNDLPDARPVLEKRLRDAPPATRGMLLLQVQHLLSRTTDKQAAFTLLELLCAPYLDLPEAHLALAQGAMTAKDLPRARQEAATALKMKPDSELAILTVAQTAPTTAEAEAALQQYLASYPNSREVRLAYARAEVQQKDFAKAREQFDQLYQRTPNDLTVLIALGLLNTELNDLPAAEKYLTAYIHGLSSAPDRRRDSAQPLMVLAQIAIKNIDPDKALRWLAMVPPGPTYMAAQYDRAQIEANRGNLAAARSILHAANANGEIESVQTAVVESCLLSEHGQPAEAMLVLNDALAKYPKNADLLYDAAMLAEKNGDVATMEKNLRKLIDIAPDNQQAYNALGYSLADRNVRLPEAKELIGKAYSLAPKDPFITDSMGWIEYRLGNLKAAQEYLQAAYQLSQSADVGVHLGEVLWISGQKDQALDIWRKVASHSPDEPSLKETLSRLKVSL